MQLKELEEQKLQKIGHAFGYYDYGEEEGMGAFYRDKDAVALYINGFARMALKGGFLHTTSEKGEGYIAYRLPGQKVSLKAGMELMKE